MILGLQELKFILNPVTRLCYGEFEAGLAGLMWSLKKKREVVVVGGERGGVQSFILHFMHCVLTC